MRQSMLLLLLVISRPAPEPLMDGLWKATLDQTVYRVVWQEGQVSWDNDGVPADMERWTWDGYGWQVSGSRGVRTWWRSGDGWTDGYWKLRRQVE